MNRPKQVHQSIINQCKNNNAKAQMQLYNLYSKAMFLVAYRYTYLKTTTFNNWGRANETKKIKVFKLVLKDQKTQLFKLVQQ